MAKTSGGLVDYSGSSESDGDSEEGENSRHVKRSHVQKENTESTCVGGSAEPPVKKLKLPKPQFQLPSPDLGMFDNSTSTQLTSDSTLHNGRKRTFAHVEGNWATFVYISCDLDEHLLKLQEELFKCLRPCGEWHPVDGHHISLSRTVVIRHHWIEPLVDSLREGLKTRKINKSFLGLGVQGASGILQDVTDVVDQTFSEFRLPPYYKNPSYHLSIGWTLGDLSETLTEQRRTQLEEIVNSCLEEQPSFKTFSVDKICLKTGNKLFTCALGET